MASSPVIAPSSPPSKLTTSLITEKSLSPPASSPLPSPPASPSPPPPSPTVSPPPSPPVSPPPASPPNSPPTSPPPNSPPPSSPPPPPPSNSPPPSSPPPPPPQASPPPPAPTSPLPSPPPTQSQSPPPPQLSSPPPPPNPDNTPPTSSPPPFSPPHPPPPPPPPSPPNTPPSPATNSSIPTPVIFSPPPPDAIPNGQPPPPAVVGKHSPPPQPSSHTAPTNKSPSHPASTGSFSPPSSSGSTEILVGVVVVAGILALVVAVFCILLFKRNKRQPYYIDPGRPPTGGDPYSPNWNSPMDHMVKISPPPGVMVTHAAGVGHWGTSPTPSPGVMVTPGGGWGATPITPQPQAANTNNEHTPNSAQHQQCPFFGPLSPGGGGGMGGFSKFQFTYEELAAATSGFTQSNLLGQGGFGFVHKGVLPDGKQVAVKSLKDGSGQGEREFQAEVEIISRVHHRHLVSLVGYCIVENQRMLVYEFVPNKTLEYHLHGKGRPVMDWATRLKIALGAAKGLAYLHEDCHPRIIHRDIKAANILLDDNNEAMVADFGLAKLTSDNLTHVSTRVMGTFGYLAPEYATSGKLTEKSDVFSFGVMLLELITGKRPVDPISKFMEDSLVDWARPRLTKAMEDGNYVELVDPGLEGKYVVQEMAPMISCAAASIRHSARRRPKMSQIARALDGDPSVDLNDGPKLQTVANTSDPADVTPQTETYNTDMYNADMTKFKKMVMSSSNDFTSSEYGCTSEYTSKSDHQTKS